jgi:uncharacterized protein
MNVTFDSAKNALNQLNHHLSLAKAAQLEWDTLQAIPDTRHNYGEVRMIGYAVMESRLYCVVFVDRGKTRRIISLRKANVREVTKYAEND